MVCGFKLFLDPTSILKKIRRIGAKLSALKAQVLRPQVGNARAWKICFQHPPTKRILCRFALSGLEMRLGQRVQMVDTRLQLHRLKCQLQGALWVALGTVPNCQVAPRQVVECKGMVGPFKDQFLVKRNRRRRLKSEGVSLNDEHTGVEVFRKVRQKPLEVGSGTGELLEPVVGGSDPQLQPRPGRVVFRKRVEN